MVKWMELHVSPAAGAAAPQPSQRLAAQVQLRVSGGEALACTRLLGSVTPEAALQACRDLRAALAADGLKPAADDEFRLASYGPLFSLQERINELWIRVCL
jgi:pre-mRNA-processing factor 19